MKNIGSFHYNMSTKQAGFEQNIVHIYPNILTLVHFIATRVH
jgi:hypothetical protein